MSDRDTIAPDMSSDRENQKTDIDGESSSYLVTFDGPDDPYNPINWTFRKKFITTISYGLTTCWITLASAIFASAIVPVSAEFNVNTETSAAATSLLVFGFGLGPLIWAPLSELYGRKWTILIVSTSSLSAYVVLTAKNSPTSSPPSSPSVQPPLKISRLSSSPDSSQVFSVARLLQSPAV
jgi:MFS family permease